MEGLDLTELVNTRVSKAAKRKIQIAATKAGIKPGTWIRTTLYKALGMIGEG